VGSDEVRFGSARPPRHWPRWLLAAAAVALAAGLTFTTLTRHHRPAAAVPRHLLGVTAGWQLVAYGPSGVIRLDLAAGRLTRTRVPPLASTGPAYLVTGQGEVIIRPLDGVPGYLVTRSRPARELTGLLGGSGAAIAGPRPGQAWLEPGSQPAQMILVWLDGRRAGPVMRLPAGGPFLPVSDGRGYALVTVYQTPARSTVYDVRPGRIRPVGESVAAVGPTGWLLVECRGTDCWNELVSPGRHRRLPGPVPPLTGVPPGVIAPDGSAAAVLGDTRGQVTLTLISLASGARRPVQIQLGPAALDGQTLAWSPDSRWLFVVGRYGRLDVVSARTGRAAALLRTLPPVSQIAIGRSG
jgi:hypothetical protein